MGAGDKGQAASCGINQQQAWDPNAGPWNGIPQMGSIGGSLLPNVLQPLGRPEDDTDAGALIRLATEQGGAVIAGDLDTLKLTPFAVLPVGKRVQSLKPLLDEYLDRPRRASGFAMLTTLEAFVEHVNRHADPRRTVIFADGVLSRLVAIYDYHSAGTTGGEAGEIDDENLEGEEQVTRSAAGEPGWCQHGAVYSCPFARTWEAWIGMNGKPMTPEQFANFLEDRIADVVAEVLPGSSLADLLAILGGTLATPRVLIGLARNLQVNVNSTVRQVQNLSTGEVDIAYAENHAVEASEAGRPVRVPSMFAIGVAVYDGGEGYQLGVKLRYRLNQGKLTWSYEIHRAAEAMDLAFDRVMAQAREGTNLPVLRGQPGAAIVVPG